MLKEFTPDNSVLAKIKNRGCEKPRGPVSCRHYSQSTPLGQILAKQLDVTEEQYTIATYLHRIKPLGLRDANWLNAMPLEELMSFINHIYVFDSRKLVLSGLWTKTALEQEINSWSRYTAFNQPDYSLLLYSQTSSEIVYYVIASKLLDLLFEGENLSQLLEMYPKVSPAKLLSAMVELAYPESVKSEELAEGISVDLESYWQLLFYTMAELAFLVSCSDPFTTTSVFVPLFPAAGERLISPGMVTHLLNAFNLYVNLVAQKLLQPNHDLGQDFQLKLTVGFELLINYRRRVFANEIGCDLEDLIPSLRSQPEGDLKNHWNMQTSILNDVNQTLGEMLNMFTSRTIGATSSFIPKPRGHRSGHSNPANRLRVTPRWENLKYSPVGQPEKET